MIVAKPLEFLQDSGPTFLMKGSLQRAENHMNDICGTLCLEGGQGTDDQHFTSTLEVLCRDGAGTHLKVSRVRQLFGGAQPPLPKFKSIILRRFEADAHLRQASPVDIDDEDSGSLPLSWSIGDIPCSR
ncbi:hypothetical protein K438DRAFT_1771596 [Mycena galopus ATCC 62051]|nr:hypothetical protein K438DRAFT_1771596 [Mycena galopus ATCC 62051]